MKVIPVTIFFHCRLRPLLYPSYRQSGRVERGVGPGSTVKDVVESLRVPHTEVGQLLAGGRELDFSHQVEEGERIEVLPLRPPVDPCSPSLLRPESLSSIRFMVDVNAGRLCPLLRMAGFDTTCRPDLSDADIAARAVREGRILLSRDRGLLKRSCVVHGHLVENQMPEKQLDEIIHLYGLQTRLRPFSRCMQCNTPLIRVEKETVMDRLEPLTRKYYHKFHRCPGCDRIYWPGSHREKMAQLLAGIGGKAA